MSKKRLIVLLCVAVLLAAAGAVGLAAADSSEGTLVPFNEPCTPRIC